MKPVLPFLLLACVSLAACGDKLDPGSADPSATDTSGTADASDGNTPAMSGNSNATADSNSTSSGTTGLCGTSATKITYSAQAAQVINNRCAVCHSSSTRGQNPDMSNYANAKSGISGGGLARVNAGSMPPPGSTALSTNETCIIKTWASQGYAN